jgi:hypothetical protein
MKKGFVFTLMGIFFLLGALVFSAVAQTNFSKYACPEIEDLSLTANQIGPGWTLKTTFYAPPPVVSQMGTKLNTNLESVKNDVFEKGSSKVQINYLRAKNAEEAQLAYDTLVNKVGNYNVLALKKDIVIEIIARDVNLKAAIVSQFQADKIHTNY